MEFYISQFNHAKRMSWIRNLLFFLIKGHSALHNEYWRLIDPQGKPTGVMGWWASCADNHDTGSTQVGDALVMKLEQFDWNPSKENQLEGS
ncbi:hypothetical protein JHK82_012054 [Glycine max]|nr:hypothetical protein JHK82_012054 [Glycine max]